MYHQYPYYIFNQNHRNPGYLQPDQIPKHWEQHKKITDMVKAISDYCNAARGIEEEYQQEAVAACMVEIERQIKIDQQRKGVNR